MITSRIRGKKLSMVEGYPYTTAPNKLREFIKGIPSRAVPEKVSQNYLEGLGMKSKADRSIIPVLKAIKLLASDGAPTENYRQFRDRSRGPSILGSTIRETYAPLYNVYDDAHSQPDANLRNHFRAKSDLSDTAVNFQIATYKTLCEFADFTNITATVSNTPGAAGVSGAARQLPAFHIDMHIHLPDSKDATVYDSIFQAISKHIMKANIF
jgi:hypothetical protein